jgi:type III pantothenate kinase
MNLVIDIGNTRIKAGVFKTNRLIDNVIIEKESLKNLQSFCKKHVGIKNAIVSSTTDYPAGLLVFLKKNFRVIELSDKTPLPFKNGYKTPKTLGKDRLAVVAGAWSIFPKKTSLVINAGTCITYDLIDNKGVYQGGAISPGIDMRFKALNTFTGRLPLIKPNPFKELVGKTTEESILTGVQQGMVNEIEGFINEYKKAYKGLQILLTGGSLPWLKTRLKSKIISEPLLALTGLNVILTLCLKRDNLQNI